MKGSSCSVRYPGFIGGKGRHLDGFSLLPNRTAERGHHQLKFWYYLFDIDIDIDIAMAPISFWPTRWTEEGPQIFGDEQKVIGTAGTLIVFCISTSHSRNHFTKTNGGRDVFSVCWGRSDHHWEGQPDYVMVW